MPEPKPNSKDMLIKAGLITPEPPAGGQPAQQAPAASTTPPDGGGTPTPTPPTLPTFTGIPEPSKTPPAAQPSAQPDGLPPEGDDATLPEKSKKVITQLRTHIKTLETQLKSRTDINPDELKKLREDREAALDLVAELQLERDPRFQAQFDAKREQVRTEMRDILDLYSIPDPDAFIKAIEGKTFKEQQEYLKENAETTMGPMIGLLHRLNEINTSRADALKNREASRQNILAQQMQAEQQITRQAFDIVFKSSADAGEPLLKEIPGQDEFNKNVNALRTFAMSIDASSPLTLAKVKVEAATGQVYKSMYQAEVAARRALEKQLQALGAAIPRATGSLPSGTPTSSIPDSLTPEEAARRRTSRL